MSAISNHWTSCDLSPISNFSPAFLPLILCIRQSSCRSDWTNLRSFFLWRLTLNSEGSVRETVIYCPKSLKSKLYTILSSHTGPLFQLCQHQNYVLDSKIMFYHYKVQNKKKLAICFIGPLHICSFTESSNTVLFVLWTCTLKPQREGEREDERENQMIATKLCLYLSQLGAAVRRFSYAELSVIFNAPLVDCAAC